MTQTDLDRKSRAPRELLIEIRTLIEEARRQTAAAVNIGLTVLYWRVGRRIRREVLDSERAAYGEQIIKNRTAKTNKSLRRRASNLVSSRGHRSQRNNLMYLI